MVCSECNGKGYVNDKRGDRVCQECDGHGEYPILKRPFDTFKHLGNVTTFEITKNSISL